MNGTARSDDDVRRVVIAKLRAMADRFVDDGTDRTAKMVQALQGIDAAGGFDDPDAAMSFFAFAIHLADGLDPEAHASARARVSSSYATEGVLRLRRVAKVLADEQWEAPRVGRPLGRAEIVRRIMPALLSHRDSLRAQGLHVPNLTSERAPRTVSDWLSAGPRDGRSWKDWLDM